VVTRNRDAVSLALGGLADELRAESLDALYDAIDHIETQAAEIERLRADRDLYQKQAETLHLKVSEALAYASRLRASLDEAVGVLRPFAVKINRTYDTNLTPEQIAKAEADDAICGVPFTNRQVRAAFAFIAKLSGGERE
jgi:hypothetical protein